MLRVGGSEKLEQQNSRQLSIVVIREGGAVVVALRAVQVTSTSRSTAVREGERLAADLLQSMAFPSQCSEYFLREMGVDGVPSAE